MEGETLAKRLEKGALSLEQALRYGVQIADALDKAHHAGVVHRDLKPGNIMVTSAGAKLLDFGLAKPCAREASLATLTTMTPQSSPVTREGTIVGTFHYMSPEQVEGNETDGRSDIFSLGAVLYEMVTGQRAFQGKSQLSVASAILEKEPAPIISIKPMTPAPLDHVIRRCLAKDPEERWQVARDVALELSWIQQGSATEEASAAPSNPARLIWGLAAICFVLLISLIWIGVVSFRKERVLEGRRFRLSVLPPQSTSFSVRNFAMSPNGQRLAFVAAGQDGVDRLWIRSLAASTSQQLNDTDGAAFPFWSGDSRQVGFFAGGKLKTVDPGSGTLQTVCNAPPLFGATWNNRGVIVFGSRLAGPLLQVPASGGTPRPATKVSADEAHRWPTFLPDGDHFLYFSTTGQGSNVAVQHTGAVYAGSLSSMESKLVSTDIANNIQFGDGKLFFVRDRSLMAQTFDVAKLQLGGIAEVIAAQELEMEQAFFQAAFSVSENGVVVFQSTLDNISRLTWFDRQGNELEPIPANGFRDPFISRDGTLLAVTSDDELAGKTNIRLYSFLRRSSTLVSSSGTDDFPLLSPDNRTVVYDHGVRSAGISRGDIFTVAADNSSKEEMLVKGPAIPNDWSKDGQYLLYMDFRPGGGSPVLGFFDFKTHTEKTYGSAAEAQVSPDGKWVAFSGVPGRDGMDSEVYVGPFPVPGGRVQVSSHGGGQPRWSSDGKELFYVTIDRKLMAVTVEFQGDKLIAGIPRMLFQTRITGARYSLFQYAVSPDGRRFLINSRPPAGTAPLTILMN